MNYEIKNHIPILLDWKDKKNHYLNSEPNYKCCNYDLNDYGYRASHDYSDILQYENKIICIGCSFTFGIGLEEEQTWPYKLSKIMNTSFLNLGFPGGSIRYALWQLYNVMDKIPYKHIFLLNPPLGRTLNLSDSEFTCESGIMGYNESHFEHFLIKQLSEHKNIHFLEHSHFGERGNSKFELGYAKDNSHYGERYQTEIANEFYKQII